MAGIEQVTSKAVRADVTPGAPLLARRGSMLAYTGQVAFRPVSTGGGAGGAQGVAGMIGRAVSGEGAVMMLAEGRGQVFYGHHGLHVTVLHLDGSGALSVEADRLLVHDTSLSSSVVALGASGGLRGLARGAMTGQGLFTTQLSGSGDVALLSHGGTIALPVRPGAPVGVDPQAYVAHTGAVDVVLVPSVSWRDAVGRGSGEAFQLRLEGTGTVHVQASERKF